ncbi:hypothetical protein A3C23_04955 [Candidatus Roizmanbacteria bacterium RIFCSPHIGHO2_02_FULL_37_13b]|uniref:N-acetyltransferase domain-containing protein n=1 Tax=Candidatus Roizmanbacteria bacterium RIFCSPLOWO2_02_FULL_36_11 TaxID=1802071 RepID=A0A1F7JCV9_9BACT|nr:MAG: hypothetical protein A3C23_04955 [Candidatus Roizmanbacteria bacterium RIFCSPHIGHO2_02_FULL_37_13b]OGK53427.1 MAG: hypothetical protein A3H78_02740 [Candidatus Roizmanbacteria bacterium RIFCSPLOWO2_02_FULL_36_11]
MEVKISVLTLDQMSQFWQLFIEVLTEDFPGYSKTVVNFLITKMYSLYAFEYWLKTNQKTIVIAQIENNIVGFAVIDNPYGGVSMCRWLGVDGNFRNKGIATKIITFWKTMAEKQGCHKLEVAAQENAKDFYSKIGLKDEGKRLSSYFGIDQYIFGMVIGQPSDQAMTQA